MVVLYINRKFEVIIIKLITEMIDVQESEAVGKKKVAVVEENKSDDPAKKADDLEQLKNHAIFLTIYPVFPLPNCLKSH